MLRDVKAILDAVLGDDDDEDYKDVYIDNSVQGRMDQLVRHFFAQQPETFIEDGEPWSTEIDGLTVTIRYNRGRRGYVVLVNGPHYAAGLFHRHNGKGSQWIGPLTPKALMGALKRAFVPVWEEDKRRAEVAALNRDFDAKLETNPQLKRFVDIELGELGMEDLYKGHTIDYNAMTLDDVAFWRSVLKQYGQ